jgi:hypothetical protein
MRYDLVEQAKENLKEQLSLYGFPEAKIDVKIVKDEEPYRVNLHLVIDAGPPLIIKTVHITGTAIYLKDVIKTSVEDVYDQHRMNNDLERIKKYLKSEGYYKPSVGPYHYRDGELEISVTTAKLLIDLWQHCNFFKNLKESFLRLLFNDVVVLAVTGCLTSIMKKGTQQIALGLEIDFIRSFLFLRVTNIGKGYTICLRTT